MIGLVNVPVWGTVLTAVPSGFVLDGSADEWRHVPRLRTVGLPGTSEEEAIWVGQTKDGIVVAGHLPSSRLGGFVPGPAGAVALPRIEFRLSVVDSLELPEMSYGEGPVLLPV